MNQLPWLTSHNERREWDQIPSMASPRIGWLPSGNIGSV